MKNTKAFTHSGIFHADDVMSSAFLKLLNTAFPSMVEFAKNYLLKEREENGEK